MVDSPKKSDIADSILAKFQQFSKDKDAAKNLQDKQKPQFMNRQKRKQTDEILHVGILEKDVGISKYISDHTGFNGIIKHRFTDFQVHEIDPKGNLVELTSTEITSNIKPKENPEINRDVLSQEHWNQIDSTLNDSSEAVEIDVSGKDKTERSIIHKTLKSVYGSKVFSNTVVTDEKAVIRVGKATKNERSHWPEDLPSFLHFTVVKKNMDTTHLVYLLSKKLRLKPNFFTYAGTKDRRAITSQRMCVKKRRPEDLAKEKIWAAKIGNYQYEHKPLRLGDLSGNKFTITIRNIDAEDHIVNNAFDNFKRTGFINYFGLQRFGSSAVAPTFHIGKALLKKNWQQAVELVLKPRPDEKAAPWVKTAREVWWTTRESGHALRHLSRHQDSIEFKVLQALKNCSTDFHGALMTIPKNTLLLYLHSYQSYVWNNIISRRIEKFQMKPQVGDLVLVSNDAPEVEDPILDKVDEDDKEEEKMEEEADLADEKKPRVAVRPLQSDDVDTASIYDVVYPLPGHDIEYPKNEIAEWYKEILSADDLSLDDLKSNDKRFSLYGTYRKPFQYVEDVTWKIIKHKNLDDDLVLSDLDKLDNISLSDQLNDGDHKSVVMDLTLKPSSYATMALREIMKANTSVSFHASQTKNAQDSQKKAKLSDEPSESCNTSNGNGI